MPLWEAVPPPDLLRGREGASPRRGAGRTRPGLRKFGGGVQKFGEAAENLRPPF